MYATYPSPDDVQGLLKSENYWPESTLLQQYAVIQCEVGARAAAAEFENVVGHDPFMVDAAGPTLRTFREIDSRGRVQFDGSAVRVESVSINGRAIASFESGDMGGYRTYPENAVSRKKPITAIEMGWRGLTSAIGYPVNVMALWGYTQYCPADVWEAVRQKAGLIALTAIVQDQSIASISEDGFNKQYDIVGIVTQKDLVTMVWGKSFNTVAGRYMRVVC